MDIPILIEPLTDGRFRAQTGSPWGLTADGVSANEAAQSLADLIRSRLANGVQMVVLNVPNGVTGAPPLPDDDLYATDWVFREMQAAIAENRRLEDAADS